jgi:hypothetical protein
VTPSDDSVHQHPVDDPPTTDRPPVDGGSALTRFDAVAAEMISAGQTPWLPDALCRAAVSVLPVDSMALSVYLGGDVAVPMGVSDTGAGTAEQLQFTLGEGPCYRSYEVKSAVLVPDIDRSDSSRWPLYATELTGRTPFRAVFAFPLMRSESPWARWVCTGAPRVSWRSSARRG